MATNSEKQSDFKVDMDTDGLAVKGHIGTWYAIDSVSLSGRDFFLMEHETYGDEAANIVVDSGGKLVLDDVFDGFDEHTTELLKQEVMWVSKLPDESISAEDMKAYGYAWGGMLPMREAEALEVMQKCSVYLLYADNTEGMAHDKSEIVVHAAKGGIFGVEKVEWIQQLERENYLKYAEMSMEDDYGMIDGIINNGRKDEPEKPGKASIIEKLKASKSEPHNTSERADREI